VIRLVFYLFTHVYFYKLFFVNIVIFPLSHTFIPAELVASIGAVIADVATVVWLVNLLLTLVRGRTANIESLTDSYTLITMHTASNLPNHVFKWNNHNIK
jgi:heme/copper-type cytochrome/quinol oxidase subunit 1